MQTTKEIETPLAKHKVVIKTMLTGAEREQVDNAENKYLTTSDGESWSVTDMEKLPLARKHALLSTSVASIDGDGAEILKRLQKMYEPDYAFVYEQIEKEQKKMATPTSED